MPQISQRFWHCSWCWCTSVSSVTSFNQLSIVKNIYLDTKINLLQCKWAELHLEVALDHIVGIFLWVVVYRAVLKPIPINSAWLKTYIWTPRSTFYDAREVSYTLKWLWTMLLSLLLVYIRQFWNQFQSTQLGQKHISGHQDQPSTMKQYWVTPWSGSGPCFCHCSWCWCTWGRSKTSSNQLSRVKNIYFDTKINLLWCQGAELHLQVTLDRVVAIIRRGNSPTNRRGRVDTRPSSSRRRTGARARSREG